MATVALYLEDEELDCLPRAAAPARQEQQCILLIEDSEEAMFLVRFALEEHGNGRYRLEWAESLSVGLEYLSKGGIDLVLLDLGLPESSGAESYAWVREIAPDLPVVVLTGDNRDETEFAVTASGAEGYLVKDQVSGAHLLNTIRTAMQAARRRGQSPGSFTNLFKTRFRIE